MTEHLYTMLQLQEGERDLYVVQNIFKVTDHCFLKSSLIEVGDSHSAAERLTSKLVAAYAETIIMNGTEYGLITTRTLKHVQFKAL